MNSFPAEKVLSLQKSSRSVAVFGVLKLFFGDTKTAESLSFNFFVSLYILEHHKHSFYNFRLLMLALKSHLTSFVFRKAIIYAERNHMHLMPPYVSEWRPYNRHHQPRHCQRPADWKKRLILRQSPHARSLKNAYRTDAVQETAKIILRVILRCRCLSWSADNKSRCRSQVTVANPGLEFRSCGNAILLTPPPRPSPGNHTTTLYYIRWLKSQLTEKYLHTFLSVNRLLGHSLLWKRQSSGIMRHSVS